MQKHSPQTIGVGALLYLPCCRPRDEPQTHAVLSPRTLTVKAGEELCQRNDRDLLGRVDALGVTVAVLTKAGEDHEPAVESLNPDPGQPVALAAWDRVESLSRGEA